MKRLNLTAKQLASASITAPRRAFEADVSVPNMMTDPRYLRQSSSLIQEALQKGFDVLQLANGDIITTGTKVIVHQYAWDAEKGKLVKPKAEGRKSKRGGDDSDMDASDIDDNEIVSESEDA